MWLEAPQSVGNAVVNLMTFSIHGRGRTDPQQNMVNLNDAEDASLRSSNQVQHRVVKQVVNK